MPPSGCVLLRGRRLTTFHPAGVTITTMSPSSSSNLVLVAEMQSRANVTLASAHSKAALKSSPIFLLRSMEAVSTSLRPVAFA